MPSRRASLGFCVGRRRRSFLAGGGALLLAATAFFADSACTSTRPSGTPASLASVTIGVPEGGDSDASDVGFRQFAENFVSEGLTTLGPDGRPGPGIVQSWEVSTDGLTWRLRLLKNVLFHDGTKCDADTVKRILGDALKTPEASFYPGLLDIKGLHTEGDDILVVELRRPSGFFLGDLYIQITKRSPDGTVIGTGPYFIARSGNGEIELRAHQTYFRGKPRIQRVLLKSYPTLRQAWASLLRNEIDAVSNLSGDAQEFLTTGTVQSFSFQRHYSYVMAFNSRRPQLRQAAVRRALNTAVDRARIVQSVLKGHATAAFSPLWPSHWSYDNSVRPYTFDPSLARATLDAVGVRADPRSKSNVRLTFTCLVPRDHATLERVALVLQEQLFAIGVDLKLEALPLSALNKRLLIGDYDAALLDLASGRSVSRVYLFWHSPGEFRGLNIFGFKSDQVDRWLDRLRFAPDEASTRAATSQLQRALLEDPPAVFLTWNTRFRAVNRRLRVEVAAGQDPFLTLWKWRAAGADGAPGE